MKKVQPGDPLSIPAETFNTFIDVARESRQRQHSIGRDIRRPEHHSGIVLIRNDSGMDCDRFQVLGITGPIVDPDASIEGFKDRVALCGATPQEEHRGGFAVLLEPVPNGAIGRAVIDGMCVVQVEMVGEGHTFADVAPNYSDRLQSDSSGSAQLVWVKPGSVPRTAWAVVRIGSAGGLPVERLIVDSTDHSTWTLQCRRLGSDGFPVGDPFEVQAFTYYITGLTWADVDPPIVIGNYIPAARLLPDGQWYCLWRIIGTCEWS